MEMKMGQATRDAFGEALREAGSDTRIVVVDGDVNNSTRTEYFAQKFPDRFFNVGIAESNLVGVASGLAAEGKTAVAGSPKRSPFSASGSREGPRGWRSRAALWA